MNLPFVPMELMRYLSSDTPVDSVFGEPIGRVLLSWHKEYVYPLVHTCCCIYFLILHQLLTVVSDHKREERSPLMCCNPIWNSYWKIATISLMRVNSLLSLKVHSQHRYQKKTAPLCSPRDSTCHHPDSTDSHGHSGDKTSQSIGVSHSSVDNTPPVYADTTKAHTPAPQLLLFSRPWYSITETLFMWLANQQFSTASITLLVKVSSVIKQHSSNSLTWPCFCYCAF